MVFDISWVLGFLVGLIVFQVRGVKKILSVLSSIGFLSFVLWMFNAIMNGISPETISKHIQSFVIGGFASTLFYLIGANISRYEQFGRMSPRMVVYVILLLLLLLIFN